MHEAKEKKLFGYVSIVAFLEFMKFVLIYWINLLINKEHFYALLSYVGNIIWIILLRK